MSNTNIREAKALLVSEVSTKFQESSCSIVTDYRGLTVAQVTLLRKTLRESGIEFQVIKNTLARLATTDAQLTNLVEYLSGPTAIAFSKTNVVAPAKILT